MAILKITVHKTVYCEHYFRVRNITGQLMLTSRNYSSLRKCTAEIYRLQFYRDFTLEQYCVGGIFHYTLETAAGVVIANSPEYVSKSDLQSDMRLLDHFFLLC